MSHSIQMEEETRKSIDALLSYVNNDESGAAFLLDPIEEKRIGAHYGETHLCAALLLRAQRSHDSELMKQFEVLFDGVVRHWHSDTRLPAYHADFNNFAIAIIYNNLANNEQLKSQVIDLLLSSKDSRNLTINWLPMRAYANLTRYKYTNDGKFLDAAKDCFGKIQEACFSDGMIDDLLPKGESFNLQYCISTIATILLIKYDFSTLYEQLPQIRIGNTMSKLIDSILPDGDVNYMGRGSNQLFAWGPWLYLADKRNEPIVQRSIEYINQWYPRTVTNKNLLLNEFDGSEQTLWWDYHYYSVYAAHFLLWYELTLVNDNSSIKTTGQVLENDSGFYLTKTSEYAVASFSGRKHYLIERGPALVAFWSRKDGSLFKCGHAPTREGFGGLHYNAISAVINHFGLIEITDINVLADNKIVRKIRRKLSIHSDFKQTLKPVFGFVKAEEITEKKLALRFECRGNKDKIFILPLLNKAAVKDFELYIDGEKSTFSLICVSLTQYGKCYVYGSSIYRREKWDLYYNL